jgi:hypothetical protein
MTKKRKEPIITPPAHLRLGKHPARLDIGAPWLPHYLTKKLPNPPKSISWVDGITSWPDCLNVQTSTSAGIGDCTIAAADHMIQVWTQNSKGTATLIPDSATLTAYEAVSGYTPSNPATDVGADPLTVLNYWKTIGIGGDVLSAYAAVPYKNQKVVMQALQLFGPLYFGVLLPLTAVNQTVTGGTWTVKKTRGNGAPGSWGGHALAIVSANASGLGIVPWGYPVGLMSMSWQFLSTYGDELYACLSATDWAENTVAPSGFNLAALLQDLKQV